MNNLKIEILNHPELSFYETILISARNCYSSKNIKDKEIMKMNIENGTKLVKDLWKAGHNTTFEHYYLTFFIEGLSRHFVYKYLHYLTPFYSTDQLSQRYSEIKIEDEENQKFIIPEFLSDKDKEKWKNYYNYLISKYHELTDKIEDKIKSDEEFKFNKKISRKKALELARYILPVGITTKLVYTVNLATLLRILAYLDNLTEKDESYEETKKFVEQVNNSISAFLNKESEKFSQKFKKLYNDIIQDSFQQTNFSIEENVKKFYKVLIDLETNYYILKNNPYFLNNLYQELFEITKNNFEILGAIKQNNFIILKDLDKIIPVLEKTKYNVKVIKTFTPEIVVSKKDIPNIFSPLSYLNNDKFIYTIGLLSHSAESQNQRHRTTIKIPFNLEHYYKHFNEKYYIPKLFFKPEYKDILEEYKNIMNIIYEFFNKQSNIYNFNSVIYLLPNAQKILVYNIDNLKYFKHKVQKRLCYNSQEEIWHFTLGQVKELKKEYNIDIEKENMLPPCHINYKYNIKPYCPEGPRFCGIKVWQIPVDKMERNY